MPVYDGHTASLAFDGANASWAPQVLDIDLPPKMAEEIQTTHIGTASSHTRIAGALQTSETMTLTVMTDADQQPAIGGAIEGVTITLPLLQGETTAGTVTLSGFVASYAAGEAVSNSKIAASVSIVVSGAWTMTAGFAGPPQLGLAHSYSALEESGLATDIPLIQDRVGSRDFTSGGGQCDIVSTAGQQMYHIFQDTNWAFRTTDNFSISNTNSWSFVFIGRISSAASAAGESDGWICEAQFSSAGKMLVFNGYDDANPDTISSEISGAAPNVTVSTNTQQPAEDQTFVAVVVADDVAGETRLYIDGVLADTDTNGAGTWYTVAAGDIYMGRAGNQTLFHEMHIYSRPITASEVSQVQTYAQATYTDL